MNNFFEQLHTEANRIQLSATEKERMRTSLQKVMGTSVRSVRSPYVFFSPRFAMPMAVALILLVGSGTAYAAQGTLPGNPLYPIKIHINEPIQVAFAGSSEAKAQINAQLAAQRLQEAEQLAQQGKLDATTTAQLQANFDAHVAQATVLTQTLQHQDPAAATALAVQLNGTITEHGAILVQLGDQSANPQTRADSVELENHLQLVAQNASTTLPLISTTTISFPLPQKREEHGRFASSIEATSSTTTSNDTASTAMAVQLQQEASSTLSNIEQQFNDMGASLDASTTANISTQLNGIQTLITTGNTQLTASTSLPAILSFTQALHQLAALHVFLDAEKEFRKHITPPSDTGNGGEDNSSFPFSLPIHF